MQNPNGPGAGLSMNRSQAALFETLQARSLSPNVQIMQNYQEGYANEQQMQQFYHSMPHTAPAHSTQPNEPMPPQHGVMSGLLNRAFSPPTVGQPLPLAASAVPADCLPRGHPIAQFNEQYSLIQQARMHHQLRTHNDAMLRKHQTFAMRQMLNPPPMSRQASAISIHQVNTSTQTTPSAAKAFQGAAIGGHPYEPNVKPFQKADKPNHLQLQQEHQQIVQSLKKDFELQQQQQQQQMVNSRMALAKANSNPFAQRVGEPPAGGTGRRDSGAESPFAFKEAASSSSTTSTPTKLLKSPQTKRQLSSLVTFSGWLYKQGSEGLRSWRKRWFVLTDYCLFYYKGPEEDKLLGSILLPSYILSECSTSESNRKFTFKLEHKNMRTYYLAAENADYMRKWMRVVQAATLMQNPNELQTRRMLATSIPISTNALSSNHTTKTYKNTYEQYGAEPAARQMDTHPSLNPFLIFDEDNERQPLYVNAPPKPRRSHNEQEYPLGMGADSYPISPEPDDLHSEPHLHSTPLNYYTNSMQHAIENDPNYDLDLMAEAYPNNEFAASSLAKKAYAPKSMPPRPRSADFLEYESKRQYRRYKGYDQPAGHAEKLPSRPKSSLDINSSMDNYHYSEASYAAKMRQSALYLQNKTKIMSTGRDDTRLNTLRYENERKRLTNEFQHYMLNNGSLTLPRKFGTSGTSDSWQFATLLRNAESGLLKGSDANLAEHYRSTDMISAGTSSISNRDTDRYGQNKGGNAAWMPDISAGTLLSKTHEELVLLLIQLRRQIDTKERGMCRRLNDMQAIQQRLKNESDSTGTRLELMGRMEVLREEVNKLEQQYEKTKPLVNLVDNMVKLGSLYRAGSMQWSSNSFNSNATLQRMRSNQKDNEHRVQLDERNQWEKYDPDQIEFQNKVQQLYDLDQRLQDESNNLQLLQQDKEEIEYALDELNRRFAINDMLPENYVTSKKIQHSLEMELSKVHSQMAENARRLEETVSGNTKLERELLILRQKLQASRDKNTNQFNYMGEPRTANEFESELRKIRDTVGDIQRQREELSMAVNQLTLDSNPPQIRARTTSLEQSKRTDANWIETDLDSMHKKNSRNASLSGVFDEPEPYYYQYQQGTDEDHWQHPDKQEIKTVRIVKRESERRHRDKDKMAAYDPFNTDFVSCDSGSDYASSYRHANDGAHNAKTYYDDDPSTAKAKMTIKNLSNARSAIKASTNKTADNMFQSNTAREILHELAGSKADGARAAAKEPSSKSSTLASLASASSASNLYKRFTPRKKKRHNTAPNSENFMDYMAERDAFKYNNRARDDLDMEVVLRSSQPENTISGPPDVIRSALGQSREYLFDKTN